MDDLEQWKSNISGVNAAPGALEQRSGLVKVHLNRSFQVVCLGSWEGKSPANHLGWNWRDLKDRN